MPAYAEELDTDFADPVPRLGHLTAANKPPVTVARDARLAEAMTRMLINDYSQLPVMNGSRTVYGYVSWATIGRCFAHGRNCDLVSECMSDSVTVLDHDTPLFEAVDVISHREFVLARGHDKVITGVVTSVDITNHFHDLGEPFLLIRQIESHLRRIIKDTFDLVTIQAARDDSDTSRIVDSVFDLTFGEYVRLLQHPSNWERLGYRMSRADFVHRIEAIGKIRNEVMHFHPDGISDDDLDLLRKTAIFLDHI